MATSSDKEEILSLLKRYRSGECTPEEAARIREWFDSFEALPDDPLLTAAADDAAIAALAKLFPEDIMEGEEVTIPPVRKARIIALRALKVAAVLLLLCTSVLFIYKQLHQPPAPVTYALLQAGKGERKKITLPDGSIVTMNANTQLRIPSDFGVHKRALFLTGEAVFDVKRDIDRPFTVQSGNLQTVVLGTSFNIKAYPNEKDVQIAVLSGKVRIEKRKDTLTTVLAAGLTPDQVLTYQSANDSLKITKAKANEIAAWQNNVFFFQQASIEEIAAVLERQYNINITLNGKAKHTCRYTLQLKNETIENAMRLLSQLSGITYQINHNEIKINTTSCE